MWRLTRRLQTNGRNSVARLLLLVVMALAIVVAAAVGAIVLVLLLLAAVVLFAAFYLRAQWVRRQLGLNVRPRHARGNLDGFTLEGEYTLHRADSEKPERKS